MPRHLLDIDKRMKKPIVSLAAFLSVGALVVAGFVGYASFKETQRSKKIKEMISSLEEQKKNIEKENNDLKEKISYLQTGDFQERIAKEKLNMQNPDEKVTVIKQSPQQEEQEVKQDVEDNKETPELPNPQKWFNHFFSYEN